jgi:hypothetical protein
MKDWDDGFYAMIIATMLLLFFSAVIVINTVSHLRKIDGHTYLWSKDKEEYYHDPMCGECKK